MRRRRGPGGRFLSRAERERLEAAEDQAGPPGGQATAEQPAAGKIVHLNPAEQGADAPARAAAAATDHARHTQDPRAGAESATAEEQADAMGDAIGDPEAQPPAKRARGGAAAPDVACLS